MLLITSVCVSVCLSVCLFSVAASLSVRHPAASVPHRRLHPQALLRVVAVLGLHLPVVSEGASQRQPGQPGSHDEPQYQLPGGPQEQAIVHLVRVLLHPPRPVRRCPGVASYLWVWVRPGGVRVAVQFPSAGQVVGMQPTARCENHQLSSHAGSHSEIDADLHHTVTVIDVVSILNGVMAGAGGPFL